MKTSTSSEQKPEVDRGLEEIRREVIESRNLVIKTDNLLKNLHAELKMVGKRQEDFQKRQWISSAVAYAVFAGLCVAGAMLISSARTSAAGADKQRFEQRIAELSSQVEKLKTEAAADAQGSRNAGEVYRLMSAEGAEERLKGVDALAKLDSSRLSALEKKALTDRAAAVRKELGQAAYDKGRAAFRRQDYATAIDELRRFVAMNPVREELLDASFFLGASLVQTRKPAEAVEHLARFVTEDKRSKTRDYAMLLLAQAYDQTSQHEKAAEVAREALATYPNSEFTAQLKNRLSAAKRGLSGGEAPAATQGITAAAPQAPGSGGAGTAPAQPPPPAATASPGPR